MKMEMAATNGTHLSTSDTAISIAVTHVMMSNLKTSEVMTVALPLATLVYLPPCETQLSNK